MGDGLVEVNTVASDVGSLLTVVNWRMNATKVTLHLDNSTGWLRPFTHVSLGSSGEPLSWSVGSDAHTVAIAPFRLEVSCHDIAGIWGAYSKSASKSLRTGGRRGSPALREPDSFAESCAWGVFCALQGPLCLLMHFVSPTPQPQLASQVTAATRGDNRDSHAMRQRHDRLARRQPSGGLVHLEAREAAIAAAVRTVVHAGLRPVPLGVPAQQPPSADD